MALQCRPFKIVWAGNNQPIVSEEAFCVALQCHPFKILWAGNNQPIVSLVLNDVINV